jgi:hypothetical protein
MDGTLEPNGPRLTRALGAELVAPTISASVASVQAIDHAAVFSFSKLRSLEFFDARRFSNGTKLLPFTSAPLQASAERLAQSLDKALIMLFFSHFQ